MLLGRWRLEESCLEETRLTPIRNLWRAFSPLSAASLGRSMRCGRRRMLCRRELVGQRLELGVEWYPFILPIIRWDTDARELLEPLLAAAAVHLETAGRGREVWSTMGWEI